MSTPTGINAGPVTDWIATRVDGLATPLTFDQIEGGASNLTYRVTDDAGARYVLRRPPPLLAAALRALLVVAGSARGCH